MKELNRKIRYDFISKAMMILFSTLLTLVLFELALSSLDYGQLPDDDTGGRILLQDDVLGWRYKPKDQVRFRRERDHINTTITTDAYGLRKTGNAISWDMPSGYHKLLIVGDSTTAGFEVEDQETYSAILEKLFYEADHPIRVYNAGVRGYGTDQSFLHLKRLLPIIKPNLVIYMFTGNDLADNLRIKNENHTASKPVFVPIEDGLELLNFPAKGGTKGEYAYVVPTNKGHKIVKGTVPWYSLRAWLHKHSFTYRESKKALLRFRKGGARQSEFQADLNRVDKGNLHKFQLAVFSSLLEQMKKEADKLILAGSFPDDEIPLVAEIFGLSVINLREPLTLGGKIRFEFDRHWNPSGHSLVARTLFDKLQWWLDIISTQSIR